MLRLLVEAGGPGRTVEALVPSWRASPRLLEGDLDVVLTQIGGPPLLLRNDQDLGHNWVAIELVGTRVNRDGIGAWVELTVDGSTQRRQVMPTRGYLSQVPLPVTFGLGSSQSVETLRVLWPDGTTQVVPDVPVNALTVVQQR